MRAQLIAAQLKRGREGDLVRLHEELNKLEQPDSGLIRSLLLQDQRDKSRIYTLVVFESEKKARERESDPRRQEGLQSLRALMVKIFDGPPEFVDLNLVKEFVP